MAELGEATVNRILHEKTTTEEEKIKKLLNSRHSIEIIDFLKNSSRPQEDYRVIIMNLHDLFVTLLFQFAILQLTCNNDPETLERVLAWGEMEGRISVR